MRHLKMEGFSILTLALVVATSLVAAPTKGEAAPPTKEEVEQEKKEIRQKSKEILAQLYKAQPNAQTSVNKAAGYAVFKNFGMKILVLPVAVGEGCRRGQQDQDKVVMDMAEIQAGLAWASRSSRLVWVFETPQALSDLHQLRLGAGRPGDRGGKVRRQRWLRPGCPRYRPGSVDLPAHGGRPGAGADREGHEVLQGRPPELSAPARSEDREAPETMTALGLHLHGTPRAATGRKRRTEMNMASPTKLALTVLALSMLVLSGCADLAIHDTASLLAPRFQRSARSLASWRARERPLPRYLSLIGMLRRRSSKGMNPRMAGIMGVFQIGWIYYGLLIASRPVIVWNMIAVVINFLSVAAYFRFARLEP